MDIVQAAIGSLENRSAAAPALAFAAGTVTSVGPCVAPRLIAVMGLVGRPQPRVRRIFSTIALAGGVCVGYVALGSASSALGVLLHRSSDLYAGCSAVFILAGIGTLLRRHGHGPGRIACNVASSGAARSTGAMFLLGCSFALVVSPCCTPIVATIAGLGATNGDWRLGVVTVTAFAIGHAIPLVLLGAGIGRFHEVLHRLTTPVATVSGALLLALGFYYAVIA